MSEGKTDKGQSNDGCGVLDWKFNYYVIDATIVWCAAGKGRRTKEQKKACQKCLETLRKCSHKRSYRRPRVIVYAPPRFFEEVKGAVGKRNARSVPLKFVNPYSKDTWEVIERNHGNCDEAHKLKQWGDWDYIVVALAKREEAGGKVAILTTDSHFQQIQDELQKKGIALINPSDSWQPCDR